MMLRWFCLMLVAGLVGCSTLPLPPSARLGLKLAPASLGATIDLQQQLRVERNGRVDFLEAALEVDTEHISMIGLALGQRVMSLYYDGHTLNSWRHLLLPQQVRGEDVLEDIMLIYWPIEAIRAALPANWRIEEDGMQRTVWLDDTPVMLINYRVNPRWAGEVTLSNLRYQYKLTIQSAPSHL